MLSYNDALAHPTPTITCIACQHSISDPLSITWYEALPTDDPSKIVYDSDCPLVPVCPSCHADPSSWLPPSYSVPGYLGSRDCERLDYNG